MLREQTLQHPSRKLYALLGELLHKKEPETFAKLIQLVPKSEIKPNQEKVSQDFISFCSIQNIKPEECRGNLYKHSKTEQKYLFIAVILAKYGSLIPPKYITATLSQHRWLTHKMIEVADTRYRCHYDFKQQVDVILKNMDNVQ